MQRKFNLARHLHLAIHVCHLLLPSWCHYTGYAPALEARAVVSLQMGNLFGALLDINAALKVPSCVNSLLPNDAIWRHDLCELSISLWEFIWGI